MTADLIVFVTATLEPSGANSQALAVARALVEEQRRVIWLALDRLGPLSGVLEQHRIATHLVRRRGNWDLIAANHISQLMRALRPDVLHFWDWPSARWFDWFGSQSNIGRAVVSVRGVGRKDTPYAWWHATMAYQATMAFNCPEARSAMARHLRRPARLEVIFDGVSAAPRRRAGAARSNDDIRRELGLPADARLIGSVAPLVPAANLKDAIWATDLLQVAGDDVHLLICGDGPARPNLQRYARQCGVRERVHFLGWRTDVTRWLGQLDLLWHPGWRDTPSLAVLEALAARVPVVACDSPGHRRSIVDGQSGYLVAAGDRANLARRAQRLLENRELAVRLGTAGRKFVRQEHNLERMVGAYRRLYDRL